MRTKKAKETGSEKSLHLRNPREPEMGAPEGRTGGHPIESGARPREAAATERKEKAMKEKEPTVLEVTEVRNVDVPELKRIVCCDNPVTGERLNACYLEDDGKRVLSLATDAVPRPMRPSGGCSLWPTRTRANGAGRRRHAARKRDAGRTPSSTRSRRGGARRRAGWTPWHGRSWQRCKKTGRSRPVELHAKSPEPCRGYGVPARVTRYNEGQ